VDDGGGGGGEVREIAIVYFKEHHAYECYDQIVQSITEWQQVTEGEFNALCHYLPQMPVRGGWNAAIIQRMGPEELAPTIDKAIAYCEKMQREAEARKLKQAEKRQLREANKHKEKLALLEKLKKELGEK
jgi:hypothetical protein